LGHGYEHAIPVLRILSIAYMINIYSGPANSVLTGMGLYKVTFYGGVIASVATLMLCPILTIKFDIIGNAIGVLFAFIATDIFLYAKLQRSFSATSLPHLLFFYDALKFPIFMSISIFSLTNLLIKYFMINKYIELMFACGALFVVYFLIFYKDGRYRTVWKTISAVRL